MVEHWSLTSELPWPVLDLYRTGDYFVDRCCPNMRPAAHFIWPVVVLWKNFFSVDLLYPVYSVSASDQKSRCNTPESNFSLTFYDKTAGTLVSSRSVELQVFVFIKK